MQREEGKSFCEPDELVELAMLYDFYGPLLKDSHRRIFEDYVWNNLSLSEIAEGCQITRQGVYDIIRRCRIRLREYESRLHLAERFRVARGKLKEMEQLVSEQVDEQTAVRFRALAEEIYDTI